MHSQLFSFWKYFHNKKPANLPTWHLFQMNQVVFANYKIQKTAFNITVKRIDSQKHTMQNFNGKMFKLKINFTRNKISILHFLAWSKISNKFCKSYRYERCEVGENLSCRQPVILGSVLGNAILPVSDLCFYPLVSTCKFNVWRELVAWLKCLPFSHFLLVPFINYSRSFSYNNFIIINKI